MSDVRTVRVEAAAETYDIVIQPGALDAPHALAERLAPWQGRRAAVVADENTARC